MELHNEVHARPSGRITLPALLVYVAVNNRSISRESEYEHLRSLPGQEELKLADMADNFFRLNVGSSTLKWERHSEFTRYSLVLPLAPEPWPAPAKLAAADWPVPTEWFASIPGQTLCAMEVFMFCTDISQPEERLSQARSWLSSNTLVASKIGYSGHSLAITDFALGESGFERMLVLMQPKAYPERAGHVAGRLVELETYRLMALRGLPLAKQLGSSLAKAEQELVRITAEMAGKDSSEQALLDTLVALAAQIENLTAEHVYRFSATRAYEAIVEQRISELREQQVLGVQTLGEFMQRRLSPAIATVAATERRLASLAERITRVSALLRTRVDIASEEQNQQLLEKLTRGQQMQLQLQTTVEGLSIAAISYYVVTLLLYGAKALYAAGMPLQPEIAVGLAIPLVVLVVWRSVRRIHATLSKVLLKE